MYGSSKMMEKLLNLLEGRDYSISQEEDNTIILSYPQKDPQYKYEVQIQMIDASTVKVSHYSVFSTKLLDIRTCSKEDVLDIDSLILM